MSSIQTHFFNPTHNSQRIDVAKAERINSAKIQGELKTEPIGKSFDVF